MARTASEVTTDILNNMSESYDRSTGSVIYDLQAPIGEEIAKLESTNDDILKNAFFDTASDEYKEIIAKDRANITRRAATYATGYVTITGTPGTEIPAGTKVASDYLMFSTLKDATVGEGGTAAVEVQCETAGSAGNVPTGAIYEFTVTISGLNSVTNPEAFTSGYDIEAIDDFSKRYYAAIRKSAGAGTVDDYEGWALEVDGVAAAVCFGRTPTAGCVTIYIMDQNHRAAGAELLQSVSDYMETVRPCPASVIVSPVEEIEIDISATIYVSSGQAEDYRTAIEGAIKDYIEDIGYSHDSRRVSVALISDAILGVDGVTDIDSLTVNGGNESILLGDTEIAVMGTVTIND